MSEFPELCELCNNHFPDLAAVFSHECPGVEALLRRHRPTLGCYATVIRYYRKLPAGSWRRRLIDRGIRMSCGDDAELLDALRKLPVRVSARAERNLIEGGLVEPPGRRRSGPAWLRRELDELDTETGEEVRT